MIRPDDPEPLGHRVAALDVGGTHVSAALVGLESHRMLSGPSRVDLDSRWPAERLFDALQAAARAADVPRGLSWGVAMPDPFDYDRGVGRFTGVGKFEAWNGVAFGPELSARLGCGSITYLNDADAFTLGEYLAGAGVGLERVVGLTLGTGVGTGWVAAGRVTVPECPPDGRAHRLTVAGRSLEDVISRRALLRAYRAGGGDPAADVREIAEAARHRDVVARATLRAGFGELGRALSPCIAAFGADAVVVGGSMARSWDLFEPWVIEGARAADVKLPPFRIAHRPDDAPLLGAAACAANASRGGPAT